MRPGLSLAYWLGPWAAERTPSRVVRRLVRTGPLDSYVYDAHERPQGVYVVAQGLHFLGPDDPRLDRFCRIVASAGFRVWAPKLRDFLALAVRESTRDDLGITVERAAEDARVLGVAMPTLMSISFGSRPAIAVAAAVGRERLSRLVVFGGYLDFDATVRFAITGRASFGDRHLEVARDPLNAPVVFSNLLPWLGVTVDRGAVARAWREMVERTWGRMELKLDGARDPIAMEIAERLGPRERELFLIGCTLAPGAEELLERGLREAKGAFRWTDPREDLARIQVPITIVHGRDDDVIPVFEAEKLAAVRPDAELLITGMYGHTGSSLPSPRALAREVQTLVRVVATLGRVD